VTSNHHAAGGRGREAEQPKDWAVEAAEVGDAESVAVVRRVGIAWLAEPFQRGTERVRTDHAGVGLGLAIVKSITEAHDGTLTLAPRPDGGLRATIELPAAPYAGTEALAPGARRPHDRGET
jgi:nitrogen fixation/metabolism regulation signal transduction histidine kinase